MQFDTNKHRHEFKNVISLKSRSEKTIANYLGHLDRFFLRFKYNVKKATTAQLTEYILASGGNSTMAQVHTTLKIFYKYVLKRNVVEKFIPYPDKTKFLPRAPSHVQVMEMIQGTENTKHKLIIMMLYATGLRVSELCNLRFSDIKRVDSINPLQLHVTGKGKKDRLVPLSEEMKIKLEDYCLEYRKSCRSDYIFGCDKKYSIRSVEEVVKDAGYLIGWDNLSPHKLRHCYAIEMRRKGVEIARLQELLGHANIYTTRIYTGVDNQAVPSLI